MARPRKDDRSPTAEQRLQSAFWDTLAEQPMDHMTVGALAARAGCNRGTFYYYYDDIYDMLDKLIDQNLPKELPLWLNLGFLAEGGGEEQELRIAQDIEKFQPSIDRLSLLLANGPSSLVTRMIKDNIMRLWVDLFAQGRRPDVCSDARIVMEFVVGGLFGLIVYRAETGAGIARVVRALSPELTDSLAPKLLGLLAEEAR